MTIVFYSQPEIDANLKNASHWQIVESGYYVFDGPDGDEVISGPFPSLDIARLEYVRF